MFIGGHHAPTAREPGPSIPIIFGTMRAHSMRNDNQILHVDQIRCEKILQGRSRMLTRDLFAVANLLVFYIVLHF